MDRRRTSARLGLSLVLVAAIFLPGAPATASTSHKGWPEITGMLLMNKNDQDRPLDGRPGKDPFGGQDPSYSCDGEHLNSACVPGDPPFRAADPRCAELPDVPVREVNRRLAAICAEEAKRPPNTVPADIGHNELLGGHGNDTLHAGPRGDVLWADYKPSGQPTTQRDRVWGGPAKDIIFASHGWNQIKAGGGNDWVKAHFGRGTIDCGPGKDTLYISRRAKKHYKIRRCERISHKTLGY